MGAGLTAKCEVLHARQDTCQVQEDASGDFIFDPEDMRWASHRGQSGSASVGRAECPRLRCMLEVFEEAHVYLDAERRPLLVDEQTTSTGNCTGMLGGSAALGLADIVDRQFPFLYDVAAFLAECPRDLAHFFSLAVRLDEMQGHAIVDEIWEKMFASRWPAFHEALRFQGSQEEHPWRANMRDMLCGSPESRCEVLLEVFDRQKKAGYAMAAMCARVTYNAKEDHYVARYFSLRGTPIEAIPSHEAHRLRFCPSSVRYQLQPHQPVGAGCYPFRMLKGGTEDLVVGQGVEVLWQMQSSGPFGWWYGELESIVRDADGSEKANVSITFAHFPVHSPWYRMQVRVGGGEQEPCAFGGFIGGIRGVTEAERKHWMRYFPKEPLVF